MADLDVTIPDAAVEAGAVALARMFNNDGAPAQISKDVARAVILAARPFLSPPLNKDRIAASSERPTHRHKKRGSEYVLVGFGRMQAENWFEAVAEDPDSADLGHEVDMREVAIYRSVDDPNEIWVRPKEEFEDGRFEEMKP